MHTHSRTRVTARARTHTHTPQLSAQVLSQAELVADISAAAAGRQPARAAPAAPAGAGGA